MERLNFFNAHYLKTLETAYLYPLFCEYLQQYQSIVWEKIEPFGEKYNKKVFAELKTKIKKFDEFEAHTSFLYSDIQITDENLFFNEKMLVITKDDVKKALTIALEIVENNNDFESIEEVKQKFIEKIQHANMKNGQVLWPTRVALSAEAFSPGALELIFILGNKKSSERISKILKQF